MAHKKTRGKKKSIDQAVPYPEDSKEVSIKKAKNGYVVSSYSMNGGTTYIAKNKTEAKKHANKLLKI